jgi:hypothetical protein
MYLTAALTFIATSVFYSLLAWLACRRVVRHLSGNNHATGFVVEHVIMPLFWRRPAANAPKPAETTAAVPS